MDVNLTSEERAQILQTIEMFEVITQTQPDDCQSLDILKEAYVKIGQQADALRISRRLAEAYLQSGLYSSALLECEGILSKQPDAAEVVALMGEIEARAGKSSSSNGRSVAGAGGAAASGLVRKTRLLPAEPAAEPSAAGEQPTLVELGKAKRSAGGGATHAPGAVPQVSLPEDDGNEQFAKFLAHHRIVPERIAATALSNVKATNGRTVRGTVPAASLLEEVKKAGGPDMDVVMSGLIDATKFGFIPLENYDIDRSVVRMLPETLTMGRLFVPFDVVSRTIMIAICNPFDGAAKEATHSTLDYHIQWYLAKPDALMRVLRDVYRLDSRD